MFNLIVTVADGSNACLYRVNPEVDPRSSAHTRLALVKRLSNPDHRKRDAERYSEPRPGLRRGTRNGAGHAVDDHRDAHDADSERRFAAEIVAQVAELARSSHLTHAVFAAGPSMLGFLRPQIDRLDASIEVTELAKELTKLSPTDLRKRLEADGMISASL